MAVKTPAPEKEPLIQLTETQLRALLAEAAAGAGGLLPPGAYREGGRVWRDVWVPTAGRVNPKTGRIQQGRRRLKRPVYTTADTSPEGLLAAKRAAYRSAPPMDFYHPDHGWLRNGSKREEDHPSNLGAEHDDTDVVYDDVEAVESPPDRVADPRLPTPHPPETEPEDEPDPEAEPPPEPATTRPTRKE